MITIPEKYKNEAKIEKNAKKKEKKRAKNQPDTPQNVTGYPTKRDHIPHKT